MSNHNNNNSLGVDTLIGATVGVVIGNQIGKGNGKTAAKIVGGVMANASRENRNYYNSNHGNERHEIVYETRCETKKHHRKEKIISGFKNYFNFDGKEYTKITKHPISKIKIKHSISF